MHITELKRELDALKIQVQELREQGVNEILAATLSDFNDRLTALELRLSN